jgi:O-methyltransferase
MQSNLDKPANAMRGPQAAVRKVVGGMTYGPVTPRATYSPWEDDKAFLSVFREIKKNKNTLVDRFRCYELWSLVGQTAKLGGDILEVGVWRGGTGCLMAYRAQAAGSPLRTYLCDTFTGVVKAGVKDSAYRGGEHSDTSIDVVKELAQTLRVSNIEVLQGIFPEDTGDRIADRVFGLCHIDVDVYASARDVLNWVWPRLLVGGVVVYDDYGFSGCSGVTRLVNEEMSRPGAITLHNLNGHAVMIKVGP